MRIQFILVIQVGLDRENIGMNEKIVRKTESKQQLLVFL